MSTSTTRSIDEIKKELEEAEARERELREEALLREREIKEEQDRLARIERDKKLQQVLLDHAALIVDELVKVGFSEANYHVEEGRLYPIIKCRRDDSTSESWRVNFETRYHYGPKYAREIVVKVGGHSSKAIYPIRKDGTFNYERIARVAWDEYQTAIAARQHRNVEEGNQKSNQRRVDRLVTLANKQVDVTFTFIRFYNSRSFTRDDNDLSMKIEHISEEDAAKIIKFMKDNGISGKRTY